MHSIPLGGDVDIDHLLVGSAGVYTVNTKHHPNARMTVYQRTVYVNGHQRHYLGNAIREAEKASRLLTAACGFDVTVIGLVVPVNARSLVLREWPAGCHVIDARDLAYSLLPLPAPTPMRIANAIYEAACRPSTWHRSRAG